MQLNNTMLVVIEGEPFLSKAFEYMEYFEHATDAWNYFREKHGGYAVAPNGVGLYFRGASPEGWTKPEGMRGFSRPKDGTEDLLEMKSLPKFKKTWDIFEDSLIYDIEYEIDGIRNFAFISELWEGPDVDWGDEGLCVRIPDPVAAAKMLRSRYPSAIIFGNPENWRLPKGLRQIEDRYEKVTKKNMEFVNG